MANLINIYSGFFMGGKHITWEFNPGKCTLPERVQEGDEVMVRVIGEYSDHEVRALQVEVILSNGRVLTHQPGGTPLHITVRAKGVPPVVSGVKIKEKGAKPVRPYFIRAKAGFFKAPPRK